MSWILAKKNQAFSAVVDALLALDRPIPGDHFSSGISHVRILFHIKYDEY